MQTCVNLHDGGFDFHVEICNSHDGKNNKTYGGLASSLDGRKPAISASHSLNCWNTRKRWRFLSSFYITRDDNHDGYSELDYVP